MDAALERMLNLLLESERAGVVVLDMLAREVTHEEFRMLLLDAKAQEERHESELERLIRESGGSPSAGVGPFAAKVAAIGSPRGRIAMLMRGQEWVARKVEETLALAPSAHPIHTFLQKLANRHRHEVEWERAEMIRLMNAIP